MLKLLDFLKLIKEEDAPGLGAPAGAAGAVPAGGAAAPAGGAAPAADPGLGAPADAGMSSAMGGGMGAGPPPSDPSGLGSASPAVTSDAKTAPINLKDGYDALDYYFNKKDKKQEV